jgi:prepilin-type N-terminal cleavage/methylation domain-containing protein
MRRDGYTLLEVMTAVVILTIGATGIIAMQGAAVHANQEANETTTAVNFATTWMERVKRDARLWNATGNGELASTGYLKEAGGSNNGVWFVPTTTAPESAGADYFGFDTAVAADVRFCANLAMTVVHAYNPLTATNAIASDANAIRADVRVWWHRATLDADRRIGECVVGKPLPAADAARNEIRKTYLSTVVSWRAPGWF